jgi:hypothetical protein
MANPTDWVLDLGALDAVVQDSLGAINGPGFVKCTEPLA